MKMFIFIYLCLTIQIISAQYSGSPFTTGSFPVPSIDNNQLLKQISPPEIQYGGWKVAESVKKNYIKSPEPANVNFQTYNSGDNFQNNNPLPNTDPNQQLDYSGMPIGKDPQVLETGINNQPQNFVLNTPSSYFLVKNQNSDTASVDPLQIYGFSSVVNPNINSASLIAPAPNSNSLSPNPSSGGNTESQSVNSFIYGANNNNVNINLNNQIPTLPSVQEINKNPNSILGGSTAPLNNGFIFDQIPSQKPDSNNLFTPVLSNIPSTVINNKNPSPATSIPISADSPNIIPVTGATLLALTNFPPPFSESSNTIVPSNVNSQIFSDEKPLTNPKKIFNFFGNSNSGSDSCNDVSGSLCRPDTISTSSSLQSNEKPFTPSNKPSVDTIFGFKDFSNCNSLEGCKPITSTTIKTSLSPSKSKPLTFLLNSDSSIDSNNAIQDTSSLNLPKKVLSSSQISQSTDSVDCNNAFGSDCRPGIISQGQVVDSKFENILNSDNSNSQITILPPQTTDSILNNPISKETFPTNGILSHGDSLLGGLDEDSSTIPQIVTLDVVCQKDSMSVFLRFNIPFEGIIYSKGFFNKGECLYVQPSINQLEFQFNIGLYSCGTVGGNFGKDNTKYFENILVFQHNPIYIDRFDTTKKIRCEWGKDINNLVSFQSVNVDNFNITTISFSNEKVNTRLEVQFGEGPFGAPVNKQYIRVGDLLSLVIFVDSTSKEIDAFVHDCIAHNGDHKKTIPLIKNNGCSINKKIITPFVTTHSTGNTGADLITYANFKAFQFPDSLNVNFECNLTVCKSKCPQTCQNKVVADANSNTQSFNLNPPKDNFNLNTNIQPFNSNPFNDNSKSNYYNNHLLNKFTDENRNPFIFNRFGNNPGRFSNINNHFGPLNPYSSYRRGNMGGYGDNNDGSNGNNLGGYVENFNGNNNNGMGKFFHSGSIFGGPMGPSLFDNNGDIKGGALRNLIRSHIRENDPKIERIREKRSDEKAANNQVSLLQSIKIFSDNDVLANMGNRSIVATYEYVANPSQFCMSSFNFILSLSIAIFILLSTTFISTFLCIKHVNIKYKS